MTFRIYNRYFIIFAITDQFYQKQYTNLNTVHQLVLIVNKWMIFLVHCYLYCKSSSVKRKIAIKNNQKKGKVHLLDVKIKRIKSLEKCPQKHINK